MKDIPKVKTACKALQVAASSRRFEEEPPLKANKVREDISQRFIRLYFITLSTDFMVYSCGWKAKTLINFVSQQVSPGLLLPEDSEGAVLGRRGRGGLRVAPEETQKSRRKLIMSAF